MPNVFLLEGHVQMREAWRVVACARCHIAARLVSSPKVYFSYSFFNGATIQ